MKATQQTERQKGFTIIEVLFVLAIAGIILMLVFMAIPTLQRNSRNSTRKQDISNILSSVSTYMLNNSGNLPPACDGSTTPTCATVFLQNTQLRFFHPGNVDVNLCSAKHDASTDDPGCDIMKHSTMPGVPTPAPQAATHWMKVYNYYRCEIDPTTGQHVATGEGAGYFDIVALYYIETGSGANDTSFECQQL